jgi:hypothetical protein
MLTLYCQSSLEVTVRCSPPVVVSAMCARFEGGHVHIVPDLHMEESGLPQPPVQLLVQDSDSLFERQ